MVGVMEAGGFQRKEKNEERREMEFFNSRN